MTLVQKLITIEDTRDKRSYEWPKGAYALLQDVKNRFGSVVENELECLLGGSIAKFHNTPEDQIKVIRSMAAIRGVKLPC